MKCSLLVLSCVLAAPLLRAVEPLALHPENPHYFVFRGKPTVLIGSTEHYGAVLNLDQSGGGEARVRTPPYVNDVAVRIVAE